MIGVAAIAVAAGWAVPAEAKKKPPAKPAEEAIPDPANGEPMTLIVSLNNQRVDIYRGTTLVTSSKVSTGMRGYATKAGVFSILEKKRYHHSNLYSGAPMPWMQRLTWSGTALHAGVVPGYPASHGCIRLPFSFAPKLFGITTVGEHVIVAKDSVAPRIIEHETLFQPLPPPNPPALVKQDHPPQRQSSLDVPTADTQDAPFPVILAKAETGGVKLDRAPALAAAAGSKAVRARARIAASASSQAKNARIMTADMPPDSAGMDAQIEDTRAHAIDPFAGNHAQTGGGAAASQTAKGHALDEIGDTPDAVSTARAEKAPAAKPEPAPQTEAVAAPVPIAEPMAVAPAAPVMADAPVAAAEPVKDEAAPAPEPVPTSEMPTVVAKAAPAEPVPAEGQPSLVTPEASLPQPGAEQAAEPEKAPEPEPSISAAKLLAGTKAAAIQAADPRSTAPLRVLVTRRTQRDRIIGVQKLLAEMGYLPPLDFDGTLGRPSITAIKEFQKANGMPETGAFNDELVKKVYEVAGKQEPPAGHLFVRQEFGKVFDAPVSFKDPDKPLGTHLFTAMKFEPGETKTRWMAVSLQGDDPAAVLDRLEIPNDLRQKISERLTPGSSLIVGDTAINSASLPKGADFLVWDTPSKSGDTKVANAASDDDVTQPRRKKKKKVGRRQNPSFGFSAAPRNFPRSYPMWPW